MEVIETQYEGEPKPVNGALPVLIGSIISVIVPGTGLVLCIVLFLLIKKLKAEFLAHPGKYKESSYTMLRISSVLTWIGVFMVIGAVIAAFFTSLGATLLIFFVMLMGGKVGG